MARKFTDVQLSRILGECDAGHLKSGGCMAVSFASGEDFPVCINQAAYLVPSCGDALGRNQKAATWFDAYYQAPNVIGNPDLLLAGLESIGVV